MQLFVVTKNKIKHGNLCLGSRSNRLILTQCQDNSSDQHWEVKSQEHIKHK